MIDYEYALTSERISDGCGHVVTAGSYDSDGHAHYLSPASAELISYNLQRNGNAVTYVHEHRPSAHHVIGCGIGHDDAVFAETGRSQAAYIESDQCWQGPWFARRGHEYDSFRETYAAACAARLQRGVDHVAVMLGDLLRPPCCDAWLPSDGCPYHSR